MIFSSFFCFSFHRELFWKPCAYQIYAKRSSNCELILRQKKKSSFFHHCLNSSSARERRDSFPPKIPPFQNFPVRLLFHYLPSVCPHHVPFPSVLSYSLTMHLNCSDFRRRVPLQCDNTMIQCNLSQRMRIMARLTCQAASSRTELLNSFEQTNPTSALHISLDEPWLNAHLFKHTHHVSIMQHWPPDELHSLTPFL